MALLQETVADPATSRHLRSLPITIDRLL